jgi:hypothetical protein
MPWVSPRRSPPTLPMALRTARAAAPCIAVVGDMHTHAGWATLRGMRALSLRPGCHCPRRRGLLSERGAIVTKPKKPLGLSGPVVYCPECLRKIGFYKPQAGAEALPVPASTPCRACKAQARQDRKVQQDRAARLIRVRKPSRSVRAASGGLPSLGKGIGEIFSRSRRSGQCRARPDPSHTLTQPATRGPRVEHPPSGRSGHSPRGRRCINIQGGAFARRA